jgi:hypothetical protein
MNRSPIYRARRSRGAPRLPTRKRLALLLAAGLVLAFVGADLGRGLVLSFRPTDTASASVGGAADSHSLTLELIATLGTVLGGQPASASQPSPTVPPTQRPVPTVTATPELLAPVVPDVEQGALAEEPAAAIAPEEMPTDPVLAPDPIDATDPITTTDPVLAPDPVESTDPITTTDPVMAPDPIGVIDPSPTIDAGGVVNGDYVTPDATDTTVVSGTEQLEAPGGVGAPTPAPADTFAAPPADPAMPEGTESLTGTAGLAPRHEGQPAHAGSAGRSRAV